MERKIRKQISKCTGWNLTGKTKATPVGTWVKNGDPSLKACHSVAQKLFYVSLDIKDWYMFNSKKSGGIKSQCMDVDDDWVNTGDQEY